MPVPTPTNGLGLLGPTDIILAGKTISADVGRAISNVTLSRTIDGASTLLLDINDVSRVLLRSALFAQRTTCKLDGLSFVLVKVAKTGDRIATTFESAAVAALRLRKGALAVAANTTSRTSFAARLVAQTPGIGFVGYPEPGTTHVPLSRGSGSVPNEDTWTALTRLANEVNWRCFESAGVVYFGPDSWLIGRPSLGTISENSRGVDFIDFDFDAGKPITTISLRAVAAAWAYPPGGVVVLKDMGVVSGKKLIASMSRSLFLSDVNVGLTGPQPSLPEPTAAATTGADATGTSAQTTGSNAQSTAAGIAIATARAQLGVPYVYGGESPSGFDCSGLMQFAYQRAGVTLPRVAQAQYNAGTKVSLSALVPGDIVYFGSSTSNIGHCGLYVGGGQMIDAPHTGSVVRYDPINGFSPTLIGATRPS